MFMFTLVEGRVAFVEAEKRGAGALVELAGIVFELGGSAGLRQQEPAWLLEAGDGSRMPFPQQLEAGVPVLLQHFSCPEQHDGLTDRPQQLVWC